MFQIFKVRIHIEGKAKGIFYTVKDKKHDEYILYNLERYKEKVKRFFYVIEQHSKRDAYKNNPDKFSKDYDSGKYYPVKPITFSKNEIEILEEIKF